MQSQKSGDESVNIQAKNLTLNTGLSYQDVKDIALDVFRLNFQQLVGVAEETATKRVEKMTDEFLEKLNQTYPEGLQNAKDPDFQYALFSAQKGYARTGDEDLSKILIDILVDRSKEKSRSLLSIVLNESLEVAPKLTDDQISILSLVFSLRYTRYLNMKDLASLKEYISSRLMPFASDISVKNSTYQHLEFLKCCSQQITSATFASLIKQTYPGLFSKGFDIQIANDEVNGVKIPRKLLRKSNRDSTKMEINAITAEDFKNMARERNFPLDLCEKILKVNNSYLMGDEEVEDAITTLIPDSRKLIESWNKTPINSLTLTSVGISIGHSSLKRITGDSSPLSIWI